MARFDPKALARMLPTLLDKAATKQTHLAAGYVHRVRGSHPGATPAQVIATLDRNYRATVTGGGAAAGAAAVAPGVGTAAALAVNVAEVGWFLEATVLYVLAIAEVHQLDVTDPERRRTLLLAVITGNGLSGSVAKLAGHTGPHAASQIVTKIPMSAIRAINKVLGRNFITKYGTKQGVLVLGRELPLGLGAAIGAFGNAVVGSLTIRTARAVFGAAPDNWPGAAPSPGPDGEPDAVVSVR